MKVVIAIDSFKGSISSPDAGAAIREGIHRVFPDAEILSALWLTAEKVRWKLSHSACTAGSVQ